MAERRGPGTLPLVIGLSGAIAAFSATFNGPRDRFWSRMTWTGVGLGSFALLDVGDSRAG